VKPLIYSADTKSKIQDYKIDWERLVISGSTLDRENGISYLEKIRKYSNNGGIPAGIVVKSFGLLDDDEFIEMLRNVHGLPMVQRKLVKTLFTETGIFPWLSEFETDKNILKLRLSRARFSYLNSFNIEGELSYYLYRYGMYNWFYNDHSELDAVQITRNLLKFIYFDDPGNVVCFVSRSKWGKWFDPHSINDYTVLLINISSKTIWLFCFSHSD
jgi:hypothetical protein